MTLKRFSIFTSVIIGIIFVTIITLACIKVNTGLGGVPDKAIVYLQNSTGVTCDETRNSASFNKIKQLYKDMTKISIIDYLARGDSVTTAPTQDLENKETYPSYTDKQEGFCVELIFKDRQYAVVSIDGDTKVIDYYSLLFIVDSSTGSEEVKMFFDSETVGFDSSKSYYNCDNPLYVRANGSKLVKYLKYMKSSQEA